MSQHIQASVQFSFPKAKRFKRLQSPCRTDYYQPQFFRSTRASGFGYGTKFDFTKTKLYTENYYDPMSSFNQSRGLSFGLGRDMVKNRSYLTPNQVPGPGTYQNSPSKTNGYSIGQKLSIYQQTTDMPGPGTYDPNINKYRSISINKGPERFTTDLSYFPGPGEYNAKLQYKRSRVRFGSAKRKCFIDDVVRSAEKNGIPGPGNYACITQFVQLEKSRIRPSTAKH